MILRLSLALMVILGAASSTAQLDPGGFGSTQIVYTATGMDGSAIAAVYVPGPLHAESGRDIWRWYGEPWRQPFRLKRTHAVTTRPREGGARDQIFPGGPLRPFKASRGALRYNWVISDGSGRRVGYLWRSADRLDWWSTQSAPYLPAELVFEHKAGHVDARKIRRARWTARIDPKQTWRPWLAMNRAR